MIHKYYMLYTNTVITLISILYKINFLKNQIYLIILKMYYSFIIDRVFYIIKAIKNRHILMSIYLYFNINFIHKLT